MALRMCPVCQGTKKIKALGMMSMECEFCEGTGRVAPERLAQAPVAGAAYPLKRNVLPEDYYERQRNHDASKLKDLNYAFKNKLNDKNVSTQQPENISESRLAEIKSKTVAREDDMLVAQKPQLSQVVKDELAALEKDRLAAEQVSKTRDKKAKG